MNVLRLSCAEPGQTTLLTHNNDNYYMELRNIGPSVADMRKTIENTLDAAKVSLIELNRHSNCAATQLILEGRGGARKPGEYAPNGLLRGFENKTYADRSDLERNVNGEFQINELKRFGIPVQDRFVDMQETGVWKANKDTTMVILSPTWDLNFNKIATAIDMKLNNTFFIVTDEIEESLGHMAYLVERGVKNIKFVATRKEENELVKDCADSLKGMPFVQGTYVGFSQIGGFIFYEDLST